MNLITLILFTILTIPTCCNGQTLTQPVFSNKSSQPISTGTIINEPGKNIMVIYQDTKNNYWFGSNVDGVYRYDGKTIIHFTTRDGLCDSRIDEIKEDASGNIYFTTGKGICQFNGQTFTTLMETVGGNNDWKLNFNDLWFKSSAYAGYVYRYDGKDLYKLKLPASIPGAEYIASHPNYPNPYAVYCVYKDSKANIWFGTATLGVCRYNGKSFDWISEADVTEIHEGPANGVRSIAEDKQGNFWFNTDYLYSVYEDKSVAKSKKDTGVFYTRIKSIGSLDGKSDGNLNEYLSITKDNNTDLWIATYNAGVWKYDGLKITHYPIQENLKNITLSSVFKDNKGDIWLGTHENGAFKFNGQSFERFTTGSSKRSGDYNR
jgi:ligand-binding sensor domain-containing protein